MPLRGIRGATTTDNTSEAILAATRELLEALIAANKLDPNDVASAIFTVTPDLTAAFPAQAARELGWSHVALFSAQEMTVPGSLPHCIRVLIHVNTHRRQDEMVHVYLRGATVLRPDLVQENQGGRKKMTTIAFQGEPGAYSQEAIFQFFGQEVETVPCQTFADIFQAVDKGQADHGVLPVENSTAGSINQAYDLLLDHDLKVCGEILLRVRHALLALPGTTLDDVREVHSHPQALEQCQRYLAERGWKAIPAYDTAGAARELAQAPQPGVAVIASRLAAPIYGLEVLAHGIEDWPHNTTRFFVLGPHDAPPTGQDKTSLVFATRHAPGALYACLGEFAQRGLNLTKLESRPRRNRPWHYVFYLDFEGHWQDPRCAQALIGLLNRAAFVKVLGSYPAAKISPEEEKTP